MLDENELLFDEIYERTKDFGRIQFIKEIMRLQRENQQLKEKYNIRTKAYNNVLLEKASLEDKIKTYEDPEDMTLMFMWCEYKAKDKIKELEHNWNELKKYIDEEQYRLAKEVSNTYEDSLGKINYVNEDIYIKLVKVLNKMQELEKIKR